jgi:probable phosphoglycerate mutase
MSDPSIQIAVVRHGQTTGNVRRAWEGGGTDSALTAHGMLQSEATGSYLARTFGDFAAIYASPLRRARQTAEAISRHVHASIETIDDLKEMHMGELEGITTAEALASYPNIIELWGPKASTPFPGGESSQAVGLRGAAAVHSIAAKLEPGTQVIIVSHQAWITLTLSTLLSDEDDFMRYQTSNCSVSLLEYSSDPRMASLDDIDHLVTAGLETEKMGPDE